MANIYIKTLGCKVNTYDSNALENQFQASGHVLVDEPHHADVVVINSCSVTATAEKEARYLLRKYKKTREDSIRIVTGCYAQTESANLAKLDEVDFVIPNEVKNDLVSYIDSHRDNLQKLKNLENKIPDGVKAVENNRQEHFKSSLVFFDEASSQKQTRAFMKIQDGCNGFCTYCLIPYARGASKSVDPDLVLNEVKRLTSTGVKEIVFTGIHIGDYGKDVAGYVKQPGTSPFVELLKQVYEVPGLKRVRISSLEPAEVTIPLLEVMAQYPHISCDHFHLPLQSGNERVLKAMRRKYTPEVYKTSVENIRKYFPNANVTADIIPGFPGETEEEFDSSFQFIQEINLNGLHVFPYSKRPNTAAFKMPGHLDPTLIKERAKKYRTLSDELEKKYAKEYIGATVKVLWERDLDKEGRRKGKSSNYLNIVCKDSELTQEGEETFAIVKGFLNRETLLATPHPLS